MSKKIVTRFAPSPTGFLHIGGARTALFNWLYAKANGGEMLLRIEDTDRKRSSDEAIAAIINGLEWLEISHDGDVISQFERADRHAEVAHQLLASGKAYKCFATPQELEEMREKARQEGRPPRYDRRWRDRDPSEAEPGAPFVVRIKAPIDGETLVRDKVQGEVRFPNKDLDDLVLLRSDGTPTYMLAVVVDDHDMGVTHIIRGDDHLTNAARQTLIYDAMGWEVPVMAHIPLIHGPDGAKLSKRHGALGIEAYREMGYLPQALKNYLVRLGWAHGDAEIISEEEMIQWFGFSSMNKAAARFDFAKLENLNGHYIRSSEDQFLLETLERYGKEFPGEVAGSEKFADLSEHKRQQLLEIMPGLKERAKTLVQLAQSADFLFAARPLVADEKAKKLLDADNCAMLQRLSEVLQGVEPWSVEAIDAAIRQFAESEGQKLGKIAQPLRAALTGTTISPGVFEVAGVLGRKECLARLADLNA